MCQFTRIVWRNCGHDELSTTPEHTLLCLTGAFKLRQGISRAPAGCHPLPDDLANVRLGYASNKIAQTTHLFDFCDDCKTNPDIAAETQMLATPVISPVEAQGDYSDSDAWAMATLHDLYVSTTQQCETTLELFHSTLAARPENHAAIQSLCDHPTIRDMLLLPFPFPSPSHSPPHPLLHASLLAVADLLHTLDTCIAQRIPTRLFSELYALTRNKLYQINARRAVLDDLTAALHHYAADPTAYEAPLRLAADQLAVRLGHAQGPHNEAHAYLTGDVPLHEQHAVAVKERVRVRRREIEGKSMVPGCGLHVARSSFAGARPQTGLVVDVERAMRPLPGTTDLVPLRDVRDVLVVYEEGLETREVLSPLGVVRSKRGGGWGECGDSDGLNVSQVH